MSLFDADVVGLSNYFGIAFSIRSHLETVRILECGNRSLFVLNWWKTLGNF